MKRYISVFSFIVLIMVLSTSSVLAWEKKCYEGQSGDLFWRIDESGLLTIEGEGDYDRLDWNEHGDIIKAVTVDVKGITSCKDMFSGLSEVCEIDLTHLDTASVSDMSYMFCGCRKLCSIDLSGFDTGNVSDMSHMFEDTGLTGINLSGFDSRCLTSMEGTFSYNDNLTSVNLSGMDLSEINLNRCFYACKALKAVNVSGCTFSGDSDIFYLDDSGKVLFQSESGEISWDMKLMHFLARLGYATYKTGEAIVLVTCQIFQ